MPQSTFGRKHEETDSRQKPIPRLRIRLYRHGLGDCILLRFARADGGTFNVLIDCGVIMVSLNAKENLTKVANDIKSACDGRLDVVVLTHEHWDHVSGFSTQQAQEVFGGMSIGEVWYGWTEDPKSLLGAKLRNERAAKVRALARVCQALGTSSMPGAAARADRLSPFLGFFGLEAADHETGIGKTREAFEYLMKKKDVMTRFCYPDRAPLTLQGVDNVRVYVLGPPMSEPLIKKSAPSRTAKEVYELTAETRLAASLETAFRRRGTNKDPSEHDDFPFPPAARLAEPSTYNSDDRLSALYHDVWKESQQDWRQIEEDWTQGAEDLALNLDAHTNNTSLVLAFEFADTGEVFLFPADAQVGSWLSWRELKWECKTTSGVTEVTGQDLLRRTVFYKVGHHGSHNATLREFGLELMQSEELVAFIPVVQKEAEKNRWFNMPFDNLVKRLQEKTGDRVLRSDQEPSPKGRDAMSNLDRTDLYFELSFG